MTKIKLIDSYSTGRFEYKGRTYIRTRFENASGRKVYWKEVRKDKEWEVIGPLHTELEDALKEHCKEKLKMADPDPRWWVYVTISEDISLSIIPPNHVWVTGQEIPLHWKPLYAYNTEEEAEAFIKRAREEQRAWFLHDESRANTVASMAPKHFTTG